MRVWFVDGTVAEKGRGGQISVNCVFSLSLSLQNGFITGSVISLTRARNRTKLAWEASRTAAACLDLVDTN